MKIWKLVAGIFSILFFFMIEFQSCAVGVLNTIEENGEVSGSAGFLCGILILAGGIVSIATHKQPKNGSIALIVLFGLAALLGFAGYGNGNFGDLAVWAGWALINAVLALIAKIRAKKVGD